MEPARVQRTQGPDAELSLGRFIEACRRSVHPDEAASVNAETWVWKDLRLFGGEWFDFSVDVLELLGVDHYDGDWDIYDYIPTETEFLMLFGLRTSRTIPDIRLREVYAFVVDGLVRHGTGR